MAIAAIITNLSNTALRAQWPVHHGAAPPLRRPTIQEVYHAFNADLCGKELRSPLGLELKAEPGHFFTIISNSSNRDRKKGWVIKAENAAHARQLALVGELTPGDITGYEFCRAERIKLVSDVIERPQMIVCPLDLRGNEKLRYIHLKRYFGDKTSILVCATTLENDARLGFRSFHLRELTASWLNKYQVEWRSKYMPNLFDM